MSDDGLNLTIGVEAEDNGQSDVKRLLEQTTEELEQMKDAAQDVDNELRDLFKRPSRNGIADSFDDAEKKIKKATRALDDYDARRKKVDEAGAGRLGDLDSGLQELGNFTGVGAFNVVGDVAAVSEQFALLGAQLPITAAGLTAFALPLAGVAAVLAVAGLAVADFIKGMQDQAKQLQQEFEAQRSVTEFIKSGATEDAAQERIDQLRRELEIEKELLNERQEAYDAFEEQAGDAVGDIGVGILKVVDSREEAINNAVKESKEAVKEYEAELRELNDAMEEGKFAASDAAESQKKTAEANQKVTDTAGETQAAGEVQEFYKEAIQKAREEAEKQIREIDNLVEARQRETEAIKDTEKSSERKSRKGMVLFRGTKRTNDRARSERSKARNQENKERARQIEQQVQMQRDANERIMRSLEDFYASREDLLTSGDFLGLFNAERDLRRNVARTAQDANLSQSFNIRSVGDINNTYNGVTPAEMVSQMQQISEQTVQTVILN